MTLVINIDVTRRYNLGGGEIHIFVSLPYYLRSVNTNI